MRGSALETDIESDAVDLAKGYRLWGVKFKSATLNGAPDRLFLGLDRWIFFVEFKKPGGRVRGNQKEFHRLLRRCGFNVYVCDNLNDFRDILDREQGLRTARVPK